MPREIVRVAATSDLADGQMKLVVVGYEAILLVRVDGRFYALEEFCGHEGGALHSGVLLGQQVVCPLHGARFDVTTGRQLLGPSMTGQVRYPVRIEGGDVLVGAISELP